MVFGSSGQHHMEGHSHGAIIGEQPAFMAMGPVGAPGLRRREHQPDVCDPGAGLRIAWEVDFDGVPGPHLEPLDDEATSWKRAIEMLNSRVYQGGPPIEFANWSP